MYVRRYTMENFRKNAQFIILAFISPYFSVYKLLNMYYITRIEILSSVRSWRN